MAQLERADKAHGENGASRPIATPHRNRYGNFHAFGVGEREMNTGLDIGHEIARSEAALHLQAIRKGLTGG